MWKYSMYKLFRQDPFIRPYVPNTAFYSLAELGSYLRKFQSVFIKPNNGGTGLGVIKAWKERNNRYGYVKERGNPVYCNSVADLHRKLNLAGKKPHVVQMAIPLASILGRPYDVRLMMMRDAQKKWQYAGMLAKVAGKKSVITNVSRGRGYAETIENALKQSLGFSPQKISLIKKEIILLGQHCNRMYDKYGYDWQIGYDIGIDRHGKIWLIEANPRCPSHALFDRLKDKTMYRHIKHMASINKRKAKK